MQLSLHCYQVYGILALLYKGKKMKTTLSKLLLTLTLIGSTTGAYQGEFDFSGNISYSDYLKIVKHVTTTVDFTYIPYEEMELKLLRYQPKSFPYILSLKRYSASYDSVTYIIFDKRTLKETTRIDQLLSNYHTKDGERIKANGFYKSENEVWLIDRYTTKGTPIAKCNSCQTYNIETYQLVDDRLILKSVRKMGK